MLRTSADSNTPHTGCLPLTDHIVFTKKSLLEFLKTKGIEVTPNFSELNRIPQYATVGTFSSDPASTTAQAESHSITQRLPSKNQKATEETPRTSSGTNFNAASVQVNDASGDAFRPTRRVREPIGGGSDLIAASLFGGGEEKEVAPRRPARPDAPSSHDFHSAPTAVAPKPASNANFNAAPVEVHDASGDVFRPTRRVREAIGGGSDLVAASLWGGGEEEEEDNIASVREKRSAQPAPAAVAPAGGKENAAPRPTALTQAELEAQQKEFAQEKFQGFRPTRRVR